MMQLPIEIIGRFLSDNHFRFVNDTMTEASKQGLNKGAYRGIEISPNISGGEGYTVTIFLLEGLHPIWGDNLMMAPKQMKCFFSSNNLISLRGYGEDSNGYPFNDYGLTLSLENGKIEKITLHMFAKSVDIEYHGIIKSN